MKKVRVYEYAKEIGKQSKDIISVLKDAEIEVSNHMSMLTEEGLAKLDSVFKKVKKEQQKGNNKNNKTENNQPKNDNKKAKKKKSKKEKNKKSHKQQPAIIEAPTEETISEDTILVKDGMTVGELSEVLSVSSTELIKKLFMELKIMANINQSLTLEQIELIAMDYGKEIQEEVEINKEDLDLYFEVEDQDKDLKERAPIVTIMGHVDHGKTTLLDTIRNTRVTAGEAGGITQHIGAYQVRAKDKKITFLDTPGHAAFTTMRARGAKITDVTILVVAADDGVMPQTIEAINHAKAAEVPIIVAVNKMDKPQANPDRVMNELVEYGLISEEWGGDTIFVPISALKGEGIDELLENILLVTEMQELKANPNRLALGTVIEAKLDKGRGAVATLLVQNGTLNVGDPLVVGNTFGRVRAMINDRNKNINVAKPSTPVEINKEDLDLYFEVEDADKDLKERAPIGTIMGHVDHGKTTLLDTIRNSRVTAGEAGGITQHIGAYQVRAKDKKITFLDTPGHAAFTTMRARGAKITDVTILVVAADDGVMPQTIEAINHAKAADVPIIVAVNKMDKPQANPDRVMNELVEYGLISEEWGGDTIFVPISALKGEGIDELLENILLVTEMQELKANPNRLALGTVIEAKLDKGRGAVATLLVQNGSLNVGDPLVVGNTFGRVRAMINDRSKNIQTAKPSTPVEITGLQDVPNAGDRFVVFGDEKTARQIGEKRQQQYIETTRQANSAVSLDTLFEQMKQGEMKDLNIIIKADVQGSVEALAMSLAKIDVEGVNVRIIHTGVGAINESDITLAVASNAVVIGFNVRPDNNAKQMAQTEQVDIRLHSIIYKVIEEIEAAMTGLLDPEFVEKVIGLAEVRQVYKVSKIGTIAGAYVTEGKVSRDGKVRVIRDSVVIYEGEIDTLRRFKDDVKEVQSGYECGMTVENFNDIKEGDVFEVYIMEEVKK